jgi:hypothetical protein
LLFLSLLVFIFGFEKLPVERTASSMVCCILL